MPSPISIEGERKRLLLIAARLGKRLGYQLRGTDKLALPQDEWRECFGLYTRAVRAASDIKTGKTEEQQLTDEQYNAELADLGHVTVLGMSDIELEKALKERKAQQSERMRADARPEGSKKADS